MSEISFDNLCDILKLLPAKSLLRFRCLSKAHCSLIDTPDFINLHLSQSIITNTNRSSIIIHSNKIYTIDLDSPARQLVECDYPFINLCLIVGSCNGLIALYHPQEGMFMWNPSTKMHQKRVFDIFVSHRHKNSFFVLPTTSPLSEIAGPFLTVHSIVLSNEAQKKNFCVYETQKCQKPHQKLPYVWRPSYKNRRSDDYDLLDGFGCDPVSDDYKWIRVRTMHKENHVYRDDGILVKRRTQSSVTVYSVKHNSSRMIADFPNYKPRNNRDCGTLVGSCLHWIVSEPDISSNNLIFSFNLEDERFGMLPVPDKLMSRHYPPMELGEVRGWLSISMDEYHGKSVDIWVMKEYGKRDSWIRILSVHKANLNDLNYLQCATPIGCSKNGNKLLLHVSRDGLWECDLQEEENQTSQQTPNVPDKRVRRVRGSYFYSQYSCVRSLVPLQNINIYKLKRM
ncbi:F-box protein CPR1-like [Mercurialis annua]|uniref:F-box protein CPR1-like n=1 Tax=Mercurialis annua TaxID=3986 RepID=UPI00216103BF|nr:F-box protein CPR1-like [Mercurialis annua]